MITADQDTLLGAFCARVDAMKPGERLKVDRFTLADIPEFDHNGARFTAADRILGNIIGSAWTHSYQVCENGDVVFIRHEDTGKRRYADPDRRGLAKEPRP